jgi:hypothetical protein
MLHPLWWRCLRRFSKKEKYGGMRLVRARLEELEPRLAPASYAVNAELEISRLYGLSDAGPTHAVVFIETSVADYQVLGEGVGAGIDAVFLDSGGDGLREMAAFLAGQHNLASVGVVAHGAPGAVALGTTTLNALSVANHASELALIGEALAPSGELDLWSCDVGLGQAGESLLGDVGTATGAAVAASDRLVGAADLGGSWRLDMAAAGVRGQTPRGEAPFSATTLDAFHHVLDLVVNSGQETKFSGTEVGSVVVRDNPNAPPSTTTFDVVGGSIGFGGGSLTAYNSSVVNISAGTIGYGGGNLNAYNSSTVNIAGGTVAYVGAVTARNSSILNITGGSVAFAGRVSALDSSTVNISGGSVAGSGSLNASDSAVVTIFGTGFNLPYGLVTQTSGNLSGTLADGSAFEVQFALAGQAQLTLSKPRALTPVVSETVAGGVYNGLPFAVTAASVTGNDNQTLASFGASTLSYTYYTGTTVAGNGSASAPVAAGTYTVVAHWASDNLNYANADSTPATFNITPAPITVVADNEVKDYGTADPALTYRMTAGALAAGDAFSGVLTRAPGESVGSYGIQQGTLALSGNYALTFAAADLVINPRAVTVSAAALNKTYGEADPALTYQITVGSLAPGDAFSGALQRVSGENVGNYAIQQGTLALNGNYTLTFVGAGLTINPRAVTVSADALNKAYGEADPVLTYQISVGSLVPGDALAGTLSRVPGENVGSYAIGQDSLTLNSNYALTFVNADLTIVPRAVTVSADTQSKLYGTPDPAFSYQVAAGSLLPGDSFTGALSRTPGENVGNYTIGQGTLALSSNYALAVQGAELTIAQRSVTVTADAESKIVGAADPVLTYHVTTGSLAAGDAFTGALTRAPGESVGTYAIQQGTLAVGSNYALTFVGANLTINPDIVAITVTADAQSKVYGNADPVLTYVVTAGALLPGDAFTGALSRMPGESVGSYAIEQGTLALSARYALTFVGASLTVSPRAITVAADGKSKIYGAPDPALTYQVSAGSLVPGDGFSGALARVPGENVSTYVIQQGTLTLGSNYAISFVGANLSISRRAVTITADGKSKTYGDPDPALTYQITAGSLASGDVISGALLRAPGENVGSYVIQQGTLALGSNYAVTFIGATLSISRRSLTISADAKSKSYGDPDPALTYQITAGSLAPSDVLSGALQRVPGENVGSYVIEQGSLSLSSNYATTFVAANLSISRRSITIAVDGKSKIYGDSDPALTYQITAGSLAPGDLFNGALLRVPGENVGSYVIQQGTLALSSNYTVGFVGANLSISRRSITITADAKNKPFGAVDPTLTYQIMAGSLAPGDAVAGVLDRAPGESVGSYAIGRGTLTLSSNYALTFVGANLTISPRSLTVTTDAKSKAYGAADPSLTYQVTGGSLLPGDTITGALSRAHGENAGNYAIEQGTLAVNSNYAITYVGANLTISARAISISANAQTKVYGGADPLLTYRLTAGSLLPGDSFTGALTRAPGENVGSYVIGQGTLAVNANYAITYIGATLAITRRTVTVTADAKSKPFGTVDPPLTYQVTFGSLVPGDAFSGALTRASGENVGSYAIQKGTLTLGSNYSLGFVGAYLTVTSATVTTQLAITNLSATSILSRSAVTFTVTAEDSSGRPVPAYNGTIQLASSDSNALFGGGTLPATYTFTPGDNGSHTFAVTLATVGNQTLSATDEANSNLTATTSPIKVSLPANPLEFNILGGTKVVAGSAFLFTLQAVDQAGNPVSNYSGPSSVTISAAPNDVLGDLPITGTLNASGFGFFQGTLKTVGSYTLNATAGSYAGVSDTITVTPSIPVYFKVVTPATATTGNPVNATVTALDLYGNIVTGYSARVHFTSSDASANLPADAGLTNGVGVFSMTLNASGTQTITATDATATAPPITGTSTAITTRGLTVTSFTPTATGFTATFSKPFVPDDLTLYGAGLQTVQDVTLVGASVGPITGSLIIDTSDMSVTFKATTNFLSALDGFTQVVLPDDTYTATLVSGSGGNGFLDALGVGLDGTNSGGTANYVATFTTHYVSQAPPVLSIPDFARGPSVSGGFIKVPNDTAQGIPITLYNAASVTDVTFTLAYDPALLSIQDISSTDATDPASSFTLVSDPTIIDVNHATADFHFSDPAPQSGKIVLGDILAVVPTPAAQTYKAKELLAFENIVINQGAVVGAVSASGVHVNAFFGDVSGNGRIDGLDVALAASVANGTATGFAAYQLLDPAVVGDVALDYAVDAGDVSDLADFTVQLPVPVIPTIATDFSLTPVGPDPTLSLGQPTSQGDKEKGRQGEPPASPGLLVSLSPGLAFSVPVLLDDPHPAGSTGMTEAVLALTYDPAVLSVSASDITLGSIPGLGDGWQISSVVDQATGRIAIVVYSTTAITNAQAGSLVDIAFHVIGAANAPGTVVQLVSSVSVNGQSFTTQVDDAQGPLVLSPGVNVLEMVTAWGRRQTKFTKIGLTS